MIMIGKLKLKISNIFSKLVSTSLMDRKYSKNKGPELKILFIKFGLAIKIFLYLNLPDLLLRKIIDWDLQIN